MRKSKLNAMLSEMRTKIEEQQKLLDFIAKHGKDGLLIFWENGTFGACDCSAQFLYEGKLKKVIITTTYGFPPCGRHPEVVNKAENYFVVCFNTTKNNKEIKRYFKVDKSNCNVVEITELYNKDESNV